MTILGKLNRRKARERLVKVKSSEPSFKRRYNLPKYNNSMSSPSMIKSPIEEHLSSFSKKKKTPDKISINNETLQTIKVVVNDLLTATPPVTVMAMASALAGSRMVLNCHCFESENKKNPLRFITKTLGRLSFRRSHDTTESLKQRYKLVNAFAWLEKQPNSTIQTFETWDQATDYLSEILELPSLEDDVLLLKDKKDEEAEQETTKTYIQKLDNLFLHSLLDDDNFQTASKQKWKQVAAYPIPSKLTRPVKETKIAGKDVEETDEEPLDVMEKVDRLFTLRANEAVQALQDLEKKKRIKQQEAEEAIEKQLLEEERLEEARKRASSLIRVLTPEETKLVRSAMYGMGNPIEVLAQYGTDSVQRQSMQTLQPGQWLNDEVIHHFYVMLSNRDEDLCAQDNNRLRSHFFKSFFITKLLNEGHANPAMEGRYEYRNVKRWSKKVPGKDLFNLDKIFFPINQGRMHWICAVAFMQEKRIQVYDSLGSGGDLYLQSIFQYLQDEHKDKKKTPLPDPDAWELVDTTMDTPQQRNGHDCGVFTCMFADFLSKDCPLVFSQEHITQCRERIVLSIMNGKAIL
jgi:sentrin-specific protease 1